jgi:hypothetical protein
VAAVAVVTLTGCHQAATSSSSSLSCATTTAADLVPTTGVHVGVNLDWGQQLLADYAAQLGRRPAVTVSFTDFPLAPEDERNLDDAVDQVAAQGGMLLLTLEPREGLAPVTDEVARALAARLDGYNCRGVPVIVRFAHEMNGSWYPWGQQPDGYVAAYRRLATAVHAGAPGSAMMWAPNYGGGYPFTGGRHGAAPGSIEATTLDTDGDGVLSGADDPYAPYWPGADAVDWVGMSLYHWGDAHPWGENEVPEPGKFVAQLTGGYVGLGGDDRAVPDFYGTYGEQHDKPVAIPETAALYAAGSGGAGELAVKQAWWRQVLAADLPAELPRLGMVNWFEWDKDEPEIGGRVDWTVTSDPAVRAAYRADLPAWARWAAPPRPGRPG